MLRVTREKPLFHEVLLFAMPMPAEAAAINDARRATMPPRRITAARAAMADNATINAAMPMPLMPARLSLLYSSVFLYALAAPCPRYTTPPPAAVDTRLQHEPQALRRRARGCRRDAQHGACCLPLCFFAILLRWRAYDVKTRRLCRHRPRRRKAALSRPDAVRIRRARFFDHANIASV